MKQKTKDKPLFSPVWKDESEEHQAMKQGNLDKRVAYCPNCDVPLVYGHAENHISQFGRLVGSRGYTLSCPKCDFSYYRATIFYD